MYVLYRYCYAFICISKLFKLYYCLIIIKNKDLSTIKTLKSQCTYDVTNTTFNNFISEKVSRKSYDQTRYHNAYAYTTLCDS